MKNNKRIGFFDSGVGGLSVLKEAIKQLGEYTLVYIGDTKRMPYGVRTPEEVEEFTVECINYIADTGLDSCVIACNTATAYGLKKANEVFDFPVFGGVEAACDFANKVTNNKKVALLATEGTVKSGVYKSTINSLNSEIELRELGCPDLVMAIEKGHLDDEVVKEVIENYLDKFENFDYDTIILGCTHFPLATKVFVEIFRERGKDVSIVDPAKKTIEKLVETQKYSTGQNSKEIEFYATGDVEKFKDTAFKAVDFRDKEVTFNTAYLVKEK